MKALLILSIVFACLRSNAQDTLSIYFAFDSSSPNATELKKIIEFKKFNYVSLEGISAFCDTTGTSTYNQILATKRLKTVLNLLNSESTQTYLNGEKEAANSEKYNAAQSRRVDIIYKSKTAPIEKKTPSTWKGADVLERQFENFLAGDEQEISLDLSLLFIPGYPVLIKICEPEIVELFELMRDHPNIDAIIHGHVCCADDFKLSFDRALMVTDYLITRGISKDRLQYKGHSNKEPKFTPEVTEADRLANRRVNVDFIKK